LIEDNLGDVRLIRELLKEAHNFNFELVHAETLSDGLNYANERSFDVIILDLSLPDSSGFDTIVKTKEKIKKFPIVVLTGLNDEVIARRALQIGAQDYLVKGQIESNTLIRAISHAIDRHEMLTTLESLARSLKNKEVRLREIIENSANSMIVVNENRIIQFVNPAAVKFFNKNSSELVRHEFKFPIMNGDNTEIEVVKKNGKLAIGVMQTVEIEWEGKHSYLLTIQDITKRKRVVDELGKSKGRLAKAQRIAQLGNWEWDIKNNKVIWSDEIYRIFGLIPQKFAATHEAFLNYVHPNDRALVNRSVDEALHNNKPYSIDHRIVLPDGSEKIVHEQAEVLFGETGEAIQMSGIIQDITERKIVEQKLRESEEKYRLIIDNSSTVIYTMDMNLRTTFVSTNVINLSGYTPAEIIKLNVRDYLTSDSLREVVRIYREELKMEKSSDKGLNRGRVFELDRIHKNGSKYTTEENITPIRNSKGEITGILGISRDITERKNAEQKLKESEEKFRTITEQSLMGIGIEQDNKFRYINETYAAIFGFSINEMLSWELKDAITTIHPDDRKFALEQLAKKQSGEKDNVIHYQYRGIKNTGDVIWIDQYSKSIMYEGKPADLISLIDISDKIKTEEKLKKSEEKYRNLIENISDAIIEVDLGRKFGYASPQIYNITGFTPEEIININLAKIVHPEDFKKYVDAIKSAIERGERLSIEYRIRHKNGHYIPISLRGQIIKDKNKLKLIGVIGDISEKRFVELQIKRLEQSLGELDALIETAPLAIILVHPKGKILRANEEAEILFNFTDNELLNLEIFQLFNSTHLKKIKRHYNKDIYNLSSSNKIETSINTKEGKIIDVEVTSTILKIENNIIIQSFFSDITERKNFERHRELLLDQLLTSLEFKSKFLATISHEFRTPLNAILGFSSLLLEDSYGETNEDQKEFLSDIFSAGDHLLSLINSVLDLSKIDAGKFKLNFERVNLTSIIKEITSIVKPLYEKKGLSFNIEGLNTSAYLSVDPIRFKQILYNLLDNAIKFTEKGNITLRGLERKDHWEFQIKDTGIGIAQVDFEVVFREYGRVENDKIKQVSGSGLGLSLTKRLINLHGGEIWFESKLGKGTTFYFTIPKENLTG